MSVNIRTGIGERGTRLIQFLLTGREEVGEGLFVLGRTAIDMSAMRAYEVQLNVSAQITNFGIGGVIELYDVTDGDVLVHQFVVTEDQPTNFDALVNVIRASERTFEVRAGLDTGGPFGITDLLQVWGSALNVRSQV